MDRRRSDVPVIGGGDGERPATRLRAAPGWDRRTAGSKGMRVSLAGPRMIVFGEPARGCGTFTSYTDAFVPHPRLSGVRTRLLVIVSRAEAIVCYRGTVGAPLTGAVRRQLIGDIRNCSHSIGPAYCPPDRAGG